MMAGCRRPDWHPEYPREDDRDAASMVPVENSSAELVGAAPRRPHLRRPGRRLDRLLRTTRETDGTPEAEVGYGLVADARGHGAATEALRSLLAETDRLGVGSGRA